MEDEEFHANMYGHAYTVEKEDEDDRGPLDLTRQIEELKAKIKNMNWLKNHDYKWLVEENRRLEQELNETKVDNRKLSDQITDKNNYLKELREKGVI